MSQLETIRQHLQVLRMPTAVQIVENLLTPQNSQGLSCIVLSAPKLMRALKPR